MSFAPREPWPWMQAPYDELVEIVEAEPCDRCDRWHRPIEGCAGCGDEDG